MVWYEIPCLHAPVVMLRSLSSARPRAAGWSLYCGMGLEWENNSRTSGGVTRSFNLVERNFGLVTKSTVI